MLEFVHHTTESFTDELDKKTMRKIERRNKRHFTATILLGATAIGLSAYWADVLENRHVEATAESRVDVRGEPLSDDTSSSAIVFLDGFGTYNANTLTKYVGPGVQQMIDGELWSVNYANAPLNAEEIAANVVELAHERDIDTVSFVGYSAGGIVSVDVAENIITSSSIDVEAIIPISTPDGEAGLREARKEEIKAMEWLKLIPGAAHSTAVRQLGEMYFRRDRFDEGDLVQRWNDFWNTWSNVASAIDNDKLPGTWLLVDQVLAISNANLEERFEAIGDLPDNERRPVIMYLGTDEPGYDYMVNNKVSSENICTYATNANLDCFVFNVPGAIHTRPDLTGDAYADTIALAAPTVLEAIDSETTRYNLWTRTIKTPLWKR